MKKIFFAGIMFLCTYSSIACDICGCSAGNYFLGPFPQFRKHFFGIRYSYRSFRSHLASDATQYSKDFYQTAELWSGWNIGRKWQLLAFVPYNINEQHSDDGNKQTSGIGDISFILNRKVLNKRSSDKKGNIISQQLLIGGGVKLPTGKFNADQDDIIPDANNQTGTGSVDYLLNAMYTYHKNDWGINTNINYKINSGHNQFRFGNRLAASAFGFRTISIKKINLNPNAGLLYEKLAANKLDNAKIADTGGNALLASGGLDVNIRKVTIGFNTQLPLSQNYSNGQTTTKVRGMLHVTFTL